MTGTSAMTGGTPTIVPPALPRTSPADELLRRRLRRRVNVGSGTAAVRLDSVSIGNKPLAALASVSDYSLAAGFLQNLGGNNAWGTGATTISLAGFLTTIGVAAGTLTLDGTVQTGTGLVKVGSGTLALSGTAANAALTSTFVLQGTLTLAKNAGVLAVTSGDALVVNSGATLTTAPGVTAAGTTGIVYDNQINTANLFVMSGGTVNLAGMAATVGNMTLFRRHRGHRRRRADLHRHRLRPGQYLHRDQRLRVDQRRGHLVQRGPHLLGLRHAGRLRAPIS